MGGGSWRDDTFASLSSSKRGKATDKVFANTAKKVIDSEMNPIGLINRESRDHEVDHPESLAIAVFLDVTGSMGSIPDIIAREKLGTLMSTLIKNKVTDASVMFSAIGDHYSDSFPLQIGQFESETTLLDKWLTSINIERGGGAQKKESYLLAWLVAGRHTSIDCYEKRGRKGFLFTIGDEKSWGKVESSYLKDLLGYKEDVEITDVQVLEEAKRMYHVFHIHAQEGSNRDDSVIFKYWRDLLGEHFIVMEDKNKICEIIASTVATVSGADLEDVVKSFDTSTALAIRNIVSPIMKSMRSSDKLDIIKF